MTNSTPPSASPNRGEAELPDNVSRLSDRTDNSYAWAIDDMLADIRKWIERRVEEGSNLHDIRCLVLMEHQVGEHQTKIEHWAYRVDIYQRVTMMEMAKHAFLGSSFLLSPDAGDAV